jgi:hypothetical protein
VVAWRPSASACSRASCLLPSPEHLGRDFEHHVLDFSRQGGPKSHFRSLMVFGDVMIYLTELTDKLNINPVEAAKAKVVSTGRGSRQIWSRVERRSTRSFGNDSHPSTSRVGDTGAGFLLANFQAHYYLHAVV